MLSCICKFSLFSFIIIIVLDVPLVKGSNLPEIINGILSNNATYSEILLEDQNEFNESVFFSNFNLKIKYIGNFH